MRHDLIIEGHVFRLRPVTLADAAEIVALRRNPVLRRYIHATSPDVGEQVKWLDRYFEREDDYYFVIERRTGEFEGTVGLYDVDLSRRSAEWGRWIIRPGSPAALESVLLLWRAAFDRLHLDHVYSRTVATNQPVVSFHDSTGVPRTDFHIGLYHLAGRPADAIEHGLDRALWGGLDRQLDRKAERLGRLIKPRHEAAQAPGLG